MKDTSSFKYFEEMTDCWTRDELLHRCYELCKEVSELQKQSDKSFYLLEKCQTVIPLHYGHLLSEVKKFLDKN